MKAKEIFQHLLDHSLGIYEQTCDGWIAGDPEKEVKKIGTCFKLTAELIAKAKAENIDMIITHELTFARGDDRDTAERIDRKKWELLDGSGLVVYRFHDHAHHSEPNYIHAGLIKAIGLNIAHQYPREQLGICRYVLEEELSIAEIATLIQEKLGAEFVRVVGDASIPVKTVCLGLGGVTFTQINQLVEQECDLLISGEVGEICALEYVRDACYFGEKKAVILIGHFSAESMGMRLLAEYLNENLIPTVYLHSGEVYAKPSSCSMSKSHQKSKKLLVVISTLASLIFVGPFSLFFGILGLMLLCFMKYVWSIECIAMILSGISFLVAPILWLVGIILSIIFRKKGKYKANYLIQLLPLATVSSGFCVMAISMFLESI